MIDGVYDATKGDPRAKATQLGKILKCAEGAQQFPEGTIVAFEPYVGNPIHVGDTFYKTINSLDIEFIVSEQMSAFVNNYYNVEDLHISEKEKSQFDYLKKSVDYYIAYLVHEKTRIKTARNLYDGKRDRDEFRYLEETFGIETPIAVRMTPIIKTRIDVLLGLLLDEVFTYKVSINDENTITEIEDAKKNERAKRILGKARS